MKRKLMTMLASAAAALIGMTPSFAQAPGGEGSASLGIYSNYVWRGQTLSEDWVAQPTVGLSYGGFGVDLWSRRSWFFLCRPDSRRWRWASPAPKTQPT